MKKFICLLFVPFLSFGQKDNPSKTVDSKIEAVTIYESGAQVERSFKTSLAVGKTQLILRGVSSQLDPQSIQAQANGNFTIVSVVHQTSFLSEKPKTDERSKLETQKNDLGEKIAYEKAMQNVYKQEELMLSKNQEINGRTTVLKVLDLKEAIDFHRNRLTEVLTKQLEIVKNIKKLEADILKINAQLTQLSPSQEATLSEVLITVSAKEPIAQTEVAITYFVPNAGWTPTYDVRVQDISKPLELGYKANVYQYSGEDWTNVNLTLSTANPRKSGQVPNLKTWLWGFPNNYSDYFNNINITSNNNTNEMVGTVRSFNDKQPLSGVTVILKGTSLGTNTDMNGNYRLAIPPNLKNSAKMLVFSFVGYKGEEKSIYGNSLNIDLMEDVAVLSEVVVTGYSSQAMKDITGAVAMQDRVLGVNVRSKNSITNLDVEETEAPTSLSFAIKLPYTIPSDGKVYTVEIKTEEVAAYYEHLCIPKIDKDVFLTAQIPDWTKYGLLKGDVNLFFEGVFVGKSVLNLPNSDTLNISLGRDKSVLVNRTKKKEFTKSQFLSNNKIENRGYEISARNTKKQAINLVIKDQFPVSFSKDTEISNQSAPEAEVNKDSGEVVWRLKLNTAQERKLGFGYSVKYPKSGVVSTE